MTGKKLLAIVLVGLLLTVGLLFYFKGAAAWRLWNIPVMAPSFADARNILAGIESQRLGYDPLFENPLDPFGRVMAYPRLWLLLRFLPISSADTVLMAAIEIGLFLVALFLFIEKLEPQAVPWIAAIVLSPSAMLCFERGNTDLIIFFFLSSSLAILSLSPGLAVLIIDLAGFLKLYPAIALGVLLRERKKTFGWLLSVALAPLALYAALTWKDVEQVLSTTTKGVGFNYGVAVLGVWVLDLTGSRGIAGPVFALCYMAVFALLLYALYRGQRAGPMFASSQSSRLDAFRIGALIYVATFLQGNMWNYRLIFLIFAIPQLVEWAHADSHRSSRYALGTLVLVILTVWSPLVGAAEPPRASLSALLLVIADELSNWGLFFALSCLLFATLPDWIREQVSLFFEKYSRSAPVRA